MDVSQLASRRTRRSTRFASLASWPGRLLAPGLALALSACSGDGSEGGQAFADPDTATFEYGAISDASSMSLVGTISKGVADAGAEVTDPGDARVEYQRTFELAFLPIELAAEGPNDVTFRVGPGVYQQAILARIPWETCVTASPEQVRYEGCRTVHGDEVFDLKGTLTRSGTTLAWDLLQEWYGDWHHLTGELDVRAGMLTGQARADEIQLGVAFTDTADLVLILDDSGCPIGGTVEMKRLYAEKQPDNGPSFWPDAGTLLIWTGCGAVTVATSMR